MDFSSLGKHCSYCNQKDYLPFNCRYCPSELFFCKNHREPNDHECKHIPIQIPNPPKPEIKKKDKFIKCAVCKKKKRPFQIINCKHCKQVMCFQHRFPSDHKCKKYNNNTCKTKNNKQTNLSGISRLLNRINIF